jgi:hypothetical protein
MIQQKQLVSVSWECVHFVDHKHVEVVRAAVEEAGILLLDGDVGKVSTKEQLMDLLAGVFNFPDYFGQNWDALEECLRDLEWIPAKGYVLVLHNSEALWRAHARLAGALVESWLFCAEEWAQQETAFHLVFAW